MVVGLNRNEWSQIADIFRPEVTEKRRLIDRSSKFDFDRDLAELEHVWNDHEKKLKKPVCPSFIHGFWIIKLTMWKKCLFIH